MTVFCRSLLDDITNASIFSSILINLAEKTYNSDYILKAYIERAKRYYRKPSEEDISRIKDYIDKIDGNFVVKDKKCTYCGACKNACPARAFLFERNFKDSIEGI